MPAAAFDPAATPRTGGRVDNPRLALDTWELAGQLGLLDVPYVVPYDFVPWRRTVARLTGEQFARFFRAKLDAARPGAEAPLSFYFHVPFCTHFCSYCRCYRRTLTELRGRLDGYTEFLLRQLDFFAPWLGDVEAQYWSMGGGTPSVLEPRQIAAVFERFHRLYRARRDTPVPTFEMSLPTVTAELAGAVADAGFRRASLGIQTLNPQVRAANRMAEIDERMLAAAVEALTARGLLVNQDLIMGLEGESPQSFLDGFRAVMSTRPASCVVNVLQADGDRVDPAARAAWVREVAPRMRELAPGYEVRPHGREIESILFFSPDFARALRGHEGAFARLASGVRATATGMSTFGFGIQCESAAAPDLLVTNVDVNESDPAQGDYFVNYKGLYDTLKYRPLLKGLAEADQALLDGLAARATADGAAGVEADYEERGLRVRFDDPDQPGGRGEVVLQLDPAHRTYQRLGRCGISYGRELTARCKAMMETVAAHCRAAR